MTAFTQDSHTELVYRLCEDLTKDIKHLDRNKSWIVPAIISHVQSLTDDKGDIKRSKARVLAWWKQATGESA